MRRYFLQFKIWDFVGNGKCTQQYYESKHDFCSAVWRYSRKVEGFVICAAPLIYSFIVTLRIFIHIHTSTEYSCVCVCVRACVCVCACGAINDNKAGIMITPAGCQWWFFVIYYMQLSIHRVLSGYLIFRARIVLVYVFKIVSWNTGKCFLFLHILMSVLGEVNIWNVCWMW